MPVIFTTENQLMVEVPDPLSGGRLWAQFMVVRTESGLSIQPWRLLNPDKTSEVYPLASVPSLRAAYEPLVLLELFRPLVCEWRQYQDQDQIAKAQDSIDAIVGLLKKPARRHPK